MMSTHALSLTVTVHFFLTLRHGPGDWQKNEGGKVSLNYTEPLTGFVILLDSPEKHLIKITTFNNSDMKPGLEIQRKEWKRHRRKGVRCKYG